MVRHARYHPRVIWSRLKTRLPLVVWGLAILALIPLIAFSSRGQVMGGVVERTAYPIGSTISGTVYDVWVHPGQPVTNGQVLARLDPSELDIQIGAALWQREREREAEQHRVFEHERWVADQELKRLELKYRIELDRADAQRDEAAANRDKVRAELDHADMARDQRRLLQDIREGIFDLERRIGEARSSEATVRAELDATRAERQRLESEQQRMMGLEDYTADISRLRAKEQTLVGELRTIPGQLQQFESQKRAFEAQKRTLESQPVPRAPATSGSLAASLPGSAAVPSGPLPEFPMKAPSSMLLDGGETLIDEVDRLRWMRDQTVLVAPTSGIVSDISILKGQFIEAGVPVITITSTNNSRVIGFVNELAPDLPAIGEEYKLKRKVQKSGYLPIEVVSIAPDIISLPSAPSLLALGGDTRGRYIYFDVKGASTLVPGESVTIVARQNWFSDAIGWIRDKFSPGPAAESSSGPKAEAKVEKTSGSS